MDQPVLAVTGGSRGIGRATALLAGRLGYSVAVGYRADEEAARQVVDEVRRMGATAEAWQVDVRHERDVERFFSDVDRLGRLQGLVNSAGVGSTAAGLAGSPAELDGAAVADLFAVNVIGLMVCCREAVRRMSTARGGKGGAVVNLSSMAATIGGRPGAAVYAASKGAVDVYSTGLAKAVAAEGVRVNVVRPGATVTDQTGWVTADPTSRAALEDTIPMGRMAEPHEIAEAVVWLLSEKASWVTGAHLDVSGGGFVVG